MSAAAASEHAVATRAGWSMAPGAALLVVAIVVAGFTAARLAAAPLWVLTPIIALVILVAGIKRARPIAADLDVSVFPPSLKRTVDAASAELPQGEARALLAAVVRQGRAFFGAEDVRFTHEAATALRGNVAELVAACCTTALDLARLDAFLAPGASTRPAAGRAELDARGRDARALFARRLGDAELALRSLYTAGVECGTPASDRVAELVTEIQSDAAARRDATAELRRLLGVSA